MEKRSIVVPMGIGGPRMSGSTWSSFHESLSTIQKTNPETSKPMMMPPCVLISTSSGSLLRQAAASRAWFRALVNSSLKMNISTARPPPQTPAPIHATSLETMSNSRSTAMMRMGTAVTPVVLPVTDRTAERTLSHMGWFLLTGHALIGVFLAVAQSYLRPSELPSTGVRGPSHPLQRSEGAYR